MAGPHLRASSAGGRPRGRSEAQPSDLQCRHHRHRRRLWWHSLAQRHRQGQGLCPRLWWHRTGHARAPRRLRGPRLARRGGPQCCFQSRLRLRRSPRRGWVHQKERRRWLCPRVWPQHLLAAWLQAASSDPRAAMLPLAASPQAPKATQSVPHRLPSPRPPAAPWEETGSSSCLFAPSGACHDRRPARDAPFAVVASVASATGTLSGKPQAPQCYCPHEEADRTVSTSSTSTATPRCKAMSRSSQMSRSCSPPPPQGRIQPPLPLLGFPQSLEVATQPLALRCWSTPRPRPRPGPRRAQSPARAAPAAPAAPATAAGAAVGRRTSPGARRSP